MRKNIVAVKCDKCDKMRANWLVVGTPFRGGPPLALCGDCRITQPHMPTLKSVEAWLGRSLPQWKP